MAFRSHGLRCAPGVDIVAGSNVGSKRRFQLVLVKPSHYDDDGYVIRWWRALIPSNSLAAVYGLALDCAQRQVLGPDVAIDIDVIDESNTRVNIPKLIRRFRKHGNFGLFGLVGVQSNQYPRALDIARSIRAANIPVAMGGFHVSGCLSMLDGSAIDLELARNLEISLFAGEAEGRLDAVLRDAAEGKLKPLYNYMDDLPGIGGTPIPFLPLEFVKRTAGTNTSFDAGRGCPFQCSFCTIINVQGRKSRFRTPDDIEKDRSRQLGAKHHALLHYRRQFRPQQGMGSDLRPAGQVARGGQDSARHHDPGRYHVPQDRWIHREGEEGRRHAGVPRAGEHQPRQSGGGQEKAEQDHRIPQDAARLEGARHLHLCRIYPRLPQRHAGVDPPRHRDHPARTSARSAGVQHPDAASGFRGPQDPLEQEESTWMPTSTSTIWSTSSRITRR